MRRTTAPECLIRGLWQVDCLFRPNPQERLFNYVFILAQTVLQGAAYRFSGRLDTADLIKLVGRNYLELHLQDRSLELAILDSINAAFRSEPSLGVQLTGNAIQKAKDRAYIVTNEAIQLGSAVSGRPLRVVNVGAVGNIVATLRERGCDVQVTDMDSDLIGKKVAGVDVVNGELSPELVSNCDVAVITGMTLCNGTIDSLLAAARAGNTKTILFAETGSSFAEFFIDAGIDCVVSEPFPFYIFQGVSNILVYRR